ncbi:MAG: alpha/beta hydrolase [Sphingorhabdus sp.]
MQTTKSIMNRRVIPGDATETMWVARDGWSIRRIDWRGGPATRGSMLFLPGRGDHYEKYLETLSYYAHAGWNVTAIDWRGQGGSGRLLPDPHIGHIDDFATWISDLRAFWSDWTQSMPGPHVVLAHSMGGHLAMRALAEGAINPKAVAMSAPMLGIQTAGLPLSLNHAFARMMCALGRGEAAAWKASEKPMSTMDMRQHILTHDLERYQDEVAWWTIRPEVKLGPPSWHWVERAIASIRSLDSPGKLESISVPILLLATTADKLVSTQRIIADSHRLACVETMIFGKEAAHELLREADSVRDQCLDRINSFFDRYAPRS